MLIKCPDSRLTARFPPDGSIPTWRLDSHLTFRFSPDGLVSCLTFRFPSDVPDSPLMSRFLPDVPIPACGSDTYLPAVFPDVPAVLMFRTWGMTLSVGVEKKVLSYFFQFIIIFILMFFSIMTYRHYHTNIRTQNFRTRTAQSFCSVRRKQKLVCFTAFLVKNKMQAFLKHSALNRTFPDGLVQILVQIKLYNSKHSGTRTPAQHKAARCHDNIVLQPGKESEVN